MFATSSHGSDLDPDIEVVVRRALALRRLSCKNEDLAKMDPEKVKELLGPNNKV